MSVDLSVKIQLNLEWLREPWLAFVHTLKNNRIYFVNSRNGNSLWAEEFFNIHSVPENVAKSSFLGEFAGNNFLSKHRELRKKTDLAEPMDISYDNEDPCSSTEEEINSGAVSNICDERFVAIAVFDTSSLIDNFDSISTHLKNRVACIIPYIVLKELDGLTKSSHGNSKKKAIVVNSELSRLASAHEDGFLLESFIDSEASLYIRAYNGENVKFVPTVNDDRILKTALTIHMREFGVAQSGGESENVFLITEDRNLTSKGISHGLNVYSSENFTQLINSNVQDTVDMLKQNKDSQHPSKPYKRKTRTQFSECVKPSTSSTHSLNTADKTSSSSRVNSSMYDFEYKERKTDRHEDFRGISSGTEKFIFIFKTAVDVSLELIQSGAPNAEVLKGILRRLSQLCRMFTENNFEHVTFSAIITVLESLYSDCVCLLSSEEKINRKTILTEVSEAGHSSAVIESIKSFNSYSESLCLS